MKSCKFGCPIAQNRKWGQQIGTDWEDYFKAYVLGRSYVGMRADDILVCARWLATQYKTGSVPILKHKITITRPLDAQGNQIEEK